MPLMSCIRGTGFIAERRFTIFHKEHCSRSIDTSKNVQSICAHVAPKPDNMSNTNLISAALLECWKSFMCYKGQAVNNKVTSYYYGWRLLSSCEIRLHSLSDLNLKVLMVEQKIRQAGRCRRLIMSHFTPNKRSHIVLVLKVKAQKLQESL